MRSPLTKLARRRRSRLRPTRHARPVRVVSRAAPTSAPWRRRDMAVAATLTLAALGPPVAVTAGRQALSLAGLLPGAMALIGALVLLPAAIGGIAVLRGLGRVREAGRTGAARDAEHAVARILVQACVFSYVVALAALGSAGAAASLLIAGLALVSGWTVLLLVVLIPAPSALRRDGAMVADLGLLSALLHFAGAEAAVLYPLYLLAIFYAGLRLGFGALLAAAGAAIAGFAAVVATTPFWQHQPALVAGLGVSLAGLPAGMAVLVRAVTRSREAAAAANEARDRFVSVIGSGLRAPVEAMRQVLPGIAAETLAPAGPGFALPVRALLSQISEVVDLAAIESGDFAPPAEPFDLHALVNDTLAPLRAAAAQHGVVLTLHIDPSVPYGLHGWPRQVAQVLNNLAVAAIAEGGTAPIRIEIGAAVRPDATIELRLGVHGRRVGGGATGDVFDAAERGSAAGAIVRTDAIGLGVGHRLVELMGGRIAASPASGRRSGWMVVLPLALDHRAPASSFDLAQRPVLLVTEDSQFAGELAEPLNAWNADTRWVGGLDDALVYVERFDAPSCPILIVDGRTRVIPALSFVHRAALVRDPPPLVLFVADPDQIASLTELGDGELTGLLAAPLDERLLENALHALPLEAPPLAVAAPPSMPPAEAAAEPLPADNGDDARVTPITAHPRFISEAATVVDLRVIGELRGLGSGDFLPDVIDSFHADARQIMERMVGAAATGDAAAFARAAHALRRCAATLGGVRLCELLLSLRDIGAAELREQEAVILQRLEAELARFEAALVDLLPRIGEMRG